MCTINKIAFKCIALTLLLVFSQSSSCVSTNCSGTGTVIILNGPSASGKTSIQRKIQEYFDEPYLKVGIDTFFDQLIPDYYGLGEIEPKGKYNTKDIRWVEQIEVDGKPAIKLHVGITGRKVIKGMHSAIGDYARQGNNLVVDYILYEEDWFPELVNALEGVRVYYIGIKYPLSVIEEREAKRSTSPVGHARSHYNEVHRFDRYDFVITNPNLSAEDIAIRIKNYISENPKPAAFEYYRNTL